MLDCGAGYMIAFALGQLAIPVGFGLWWVTCIGIPVLIDSINTRITRRRIGK